MDSVNGTEQQATIRLESSAVAPPPPQPPVVPQPPPQNEEEQATTMLPRGPIPPVQPPVQGPVQRPQTGAQPPAPAEYEPVGAGERDVHAPESRVAAETAVREPESVAAAPQPVREPEPPVPAAEPVVPAVPRREQSRSRRRHAAGDPRPVASGFPAVRPRRLRRT